MLDFRRLAVRCQPLAVLRFRKVDVLPNIKSAAKRVKVSERRRQRNRVFISAARTRIRRAERLIQSGDADSAALAVGDAISTLDRAANKGIIHKNNAARRKSRLRRKFNDLVGAGVADA
jgi:small subunit ribosomal protein S20